MPNHISPAPQKFCVETGKKQVKAAPPVEQPRAVPDKAAGPKKS